jgi:RNA polymerase sigma-70 factor (ECF subfamily)
VETALTAALSSPAQVMEQGISADSFDEIVRQHQRRVYRVLFLLVKDADAANTLTQECFLRAYQHRASFRGECAIVTWLLRIAVNLARDHGKSRRTSFWRSLVGLEQADSGQAAAMAMAAPQPSPERVLLGREKLDAVWSAVESLAPQQRAIFLLRFAEEMSLAEMAEVLGLKTGTIKAQLFRATAKVKRTMKEKSCNS